MFSAMYCIDPGRSSSSSPRAPSSPATSVCVRSKAIACSRELTDACHVGSRIVSYVWLQAGVVKRDRNRAGLVVTVVGEEGVGEGDGEVGGKGVGGKGVGGEGVGGKGRAEIGRAHV